MTPEQRKEAVELVAPLRTAKNHEAMAVWLEGMERRGEVFSVFLLLQKMKKYRDWYHAVKLLAENGNTMPPAIARWLKRNPRCTMRKTDMPNSAMFLAVGMLIDKYGINPTRNKETQHRDTACDLVGDAFCRSYDAIESQYRRYLAKLAKQL